ncbi:MAG: TonB-dependent receptor [Bacteroidales bacterium]|nr:TonB-dependent receptor [Bacteroidales bacterium]
MKQLLLLIPGLFFLFTHASTQNIRDTLRINEIRIEDTLAERAGHLSRKSITPQVFLTGRDLNSLGHYGLGGVLRRQARIVMQGPPMSYRNARISGLERSYQGIYIEGIRPSGGEDRRDFKLDRIPVSLVSQIILNDLPGASKPSDALAGLIDIRLKTVPHEKIFGGSVIMTSALNPLHPGGELNLFYGQPEHNRIPGFYGHLALDTRPGRTTVFLSDDESGINGTNHISYRIADQSVYGTLHYRLNKSSDGSVKIWNTKQVQNETATGEVSHRSRGGLQLRNDSAFEQNKRSLLMAVWMHQFHREKTVWKNRISYSGSGLNKYRDRFREKESGIEKSLENEDQQLTSLDNHLQMNWLCDKSLRVHAGLNLHYNRRNVSRMTFMGLSGQPFWDQWENASYLLYDWQSAGYIEIESHVGSLILLPGFRTEWEQMHFKTTATQGESAYLQWLPSMHLKWNVNKHHVFRVGIARKMARPPYLYWVPVEKIKHKKQVIEVGNPDLVAAAGWNSEIVWAWHSPNFLNLSLSGYLNKMDDMYETRFLGFDTLYHYRIYKPVNLNRALIYGLVAAAKIRVGGIRGNKLLLAGNYSWNASRVKDPDMDIYRSLNDQVHHLFNMTAFYYLSKWRTRIEAGINLTGFSTVFESTDTEGHIIEAITRLPFQQLDAGVRWYFSDHGSAFLMLQNLTGSKIKIRQGSVIEITAIGIWMRLGCNFNL